jgi:hypothetical protein
VEGVAKERTFAGRSSHSVGVTTFLVARSWVSLNSHFGGKLISIHPYDA